MENYAFSDLLGIATWILGGIILLRNGGQAVLDIIKAVKAPNDAQDKRIHDLEGRMQHVEDCLDNDNKRFKKLEDGNRVTVLSLLALLDHGLDGNNVKQMEDAKKEINGYLVNK